MCQRADRCGGRERATADTAVSTVRHGERGATPTAVRAQLAATVASAAGPYGYTISLGGSFGVASDQLGTPHLGGAFLLMLGAVAGFVLLEVLAHGRSGERVAPAEPPPSLWANAHILSVGIALLGVWAAVHLAGGGAAWALTGFVATFAYFLVTALQRIAIERLGRRPR